MELKRERMPAREWEEKKLKSGEKAYRKDHEGAIKAKRRYDRKLAKLDDTAEMAENTDMISEPVKIERKREGTEKRHDNRIGKSGEATSKE